MAEQRAVKSNLQRFGCSRFPNQEYLLDVLGINSTDALLNINKETLNTVHKNLSGAVDKAVAVDSCADCGLMTIQSSDCTALYINLLSNRVVDPHAVLLGNLYQDAVLNFKRVMQHMVTTKSRTDGVELTKLPKNTQPKTTAFKNWCTIIEE